MSISEDNLIKFNATVERISTTASGAIRIVLDMPEGNIDQAAALMEARRLNALVEVIAVLVKNG